MVTGDNLSTATAIAKECGILRSDYVKEVEDYEVMEGREFRRMVGGLKKSTNKDGEEIMIVKDLFRF